jgi:charged multivesicular body protein 7
MIPCQEFLDASTSIYSRSWSIKPWWLLSWSLKQLGFFEKHTTLGRLPTAQYVVVPNVEVRQGGDLLPKASLTVQ